MRRPRVYLRTQRTARVELGQGDVTLFGPLDYSMRVWLDTDRIAQLGLTPGDVQAAIRAQNVQAPVGRIGARPISDDQQFQLTITTEGRLASAEQFERIVGGPAVQLATEA